MIDPNAPTMRRLTVARALLVVVAVIAAATAATKPADILAMVGWAFSLAMAGNFPALVMGVWWKRATTATGAVCGIIAGFGLCLFYLVTTRYFPGAGVKYFGMTSLTKPADGCSRWSISRKPWRCPMPWRLPDDSAHPMANKVGWFDLNNIACGLLGTPLGFVVIYVVSTRQGAVGGNAGLSSTTSASRGAGRCSRRRPPSAFSRLDIDRRGPSGPRLCFGAP